MPYAPAVLPILHDVAAPLAAAWGSFHELVRKGKGHNDVATALDIATETLARDRLAVIFPDIPFEGEESGGSRKKDRYWLMDPIDGTQRFARGEEGCTSQLALIENGAPIFSAIYDFLRDDMYWAEKGMGAYCNETPLRVSTRSLNEGALFCEVGKRKYESDEFRRVTHLTRAVVSNVSGWEFIQVARGDIEGRLMLDPHGFDYDFAPGILLVQEAGGMAANIGSDRYQVRDRNVLAANPAVFTALTDGPGAVFPITEQA